MPFRSKAQSRLFHAAMRNPRLARQKGLSEKTISDFVEAEHGHKLDGLPEHVQKKAAGGRSLAKTASYSDYGTALPGGAEDWSQGVNRAIRHSDEPDPDAEREMNAIRRDLTQSQLYPDTEGQMAKGGAVDYMRPTKW